MVNAGSWFDPRNTTNALKTLYALSPSEFSITSPHSAQTPLEARTPLAAEPVHYQGGGPQTTRTASAFSWGRKKK